MWEPEDPDTKSNPFQPVLARESLVTHSSVVHKALLSPSIQPSCTQDAMFVYWTVKGSDDGLEMASDCLLLIVIGYSSGRLVDS